MTVVTNQQRAFASLQSIYQRWICSQIRSKQTISSYLCTQDGPGVYPVIGTVTAGVIPNFKGILFGVDEVLG